MNWMIIFSKYDISSELIMLGLAVIFMIAMAIMRPKKSRTFYLNKIQFITAIAAILVHIALLQLTCEPEQFTHTRYVVLYTIYSLLYITILNELTVYLDLLSYQKRHNIHEIVIKIIIETVAYLVVIYYPIVTDKAYVITESGDIELTKWHFVIEVCGIICALCEGLSCLIRAKSLSRIVSIGVMVFVPIEILVLNFQFYFNTAYFTSFTYVVPMVVFYMLFHCNVFDPDSGCQGVNALWTMIEYAIRKGQDYVLVDVTFPELKNREFSDTSMIIQDATAHVCRKIERIRFGARIFSPNSYSYTYFCKIKDKSEAEKIACEIREILESPFNHKGKLFSAHYKQIVVTGNPILTSSIQTKSMLGYIKMRMGENGGSEYYIATEEDYKRFERYDAAEKAVLDIRQKSSLYDSRIICYIQPIYSTKDGSFKSGEALMRMKIDDTMVFPDTFIPAAEHNNCIHRMTLIMLNSVCRKIKELEDAEYDFDGITINCSTSELADVTFSKEVIMIVEFSGIQPSHLRLEITESISVTNYQNILANMEALDAYGIQFYLDDFGTGFSNLERIMKFPFKTIKFDKSILYSALENAKADALVRMQVEYFHENGYRTVVEGVEDEAQYKYCEEVGFDMIQGYYFARPQPEEKITEYFVK